MDTSNDSIRIMIATWSILTLSIAVVQCASIYSNIDVLTNPNFEPICSEHQERFIESDGKESSLILEFNSGILLSNSTTSSCKRILSAPESYGFIVRLIRPKIRKTHHHSAGTEKIENGRGTFGGSIGKNINDMNIMKKINFSVTAARSCPLSIFSSLDPLKPSWRVDPCQLEDTSIDMEDPVRLFQGRLRIVWERSYNSLDSKLMVTVLGKGVACQQTNKHPCLKIGLEPLLCISKDLVCDGIRHCPYSNEYDSDEDYKMCWKRKKIDDNTESDIWEHWAIEIFRNLFAFDAPTMPTAATDGSATTNAAGISSTAFPSDVTGVNSTTTLTKVVSKSMEKNATSVNGGTNSGNDPVTVGYGNTTDGSSGPSKRNSTRSGLNSDLSKYGPWGYLMLGMLLCGGALLICGLWASASQSGQNDGDSTTQHGGSSGVNGNSSIDHQSSAPPNYEELDPPPPYSVLFPNQKANSTTTLSEQSSVQPPTPVTNLNSSLVTQTTVAIEPNSSSTVATS